MDEWDRVRRKIRELEGSFLRTKHDIRPEFDSSSIAEFWKKRYDDEKNAWERMLASKEKEQASIQEKFLTDEKGIAELSFKIKELEQKLESEKVLWEERSKTRVLEAELDKRKMAWEDEVMMLRQENEHLKIQVQKGARLTEEEIQQFSKMQTDKRRMEEELKNLESKMKTLADQERRNIQNLESEKQSLLKKLEELQNLKKEGEKKREEVDQEISFLTKEYSQRILWLQEREKDQQSSFENLARGFAHKVGNYLKIVSGILEWCPANFKMEKELDEQLSLADQNTKETLKSIHDFLTLSKYPVVNPKKTDINDLLRGVVVTVQEIAGKEEISISTNFEKELPPLNLDLQLLLEAFKQLLLNAMEASKPGGTITLSTQTEGSPKKAVIRIADKGEGISDQTLQRIQQPYFSTRKGKKGLGLTIAKQAIDLHHGSLTITSNKNEGTTVTIQLPI